MISFFILRQNQMGRKGRNFRRLLRIIVSIDNKIITVNVNNREKIDKSELSKLKKSTDNEENKDVQPNKAPRMSETTVQSIDDLNSTLTISETFIYDNPSLDVFCYDDEMMDNMYIDKEQDLYFDTNDY